MKITELTLEERIKTGCTHLAEIDYTDLAAAGATTAVTLDLATYVARDCVTHALFDLVTPFDGGATSALALKVGFDGATVDDDDAFIQSEELHLDATEVLASVGVPPAVATDTVDGTYGNEERDVIISLRNVVESFRARRKAFVEAGKIQAIFTATGGNLNALTVGKVRIYFNKVRLTGIRGIND
jgi:hypothetical protein